MKKHLFILQFTISLFYTSLFAQWVQQTLPVSGQINDLVFLNKDTGFAALDNSNFLRTTNGGTNWTLSSNFRILVLNKIDSVTAYGMGVVNSKIYRTFNGGATWDSVSPVGSMCWISFISRDTGWISSLGGIYKTTDGGLTASFISNQQTCGKLTFLKTKYSNENYGWIINNGLYKTTNSGVNWLNVNGISTGAINCYYLNKDTGWVSDDPPVGILRILFTSNGGNNWTNQFFEQDAGGDIFFVNPKKGWIGGAFLKMFGTTDGGQNWGTQNTPVTFSTQVFFIDTLLGWSGQNGIAKTTNGGGNFVGIANLVNLFPKDYTLYQNYPNPFNPSTNIEFSVNKRSFIQLLIFDLLGREVEQLVNEELAIGIYRAVWNGEKYSSGIYYYKLITENYIETRKMVLIK